MEYTIENLKKFVKTVDWSYDYSDDSRVWRRGEEQMVELRKFNDALKATHAEELRAIYAPFSYYAPNLG